MLGVAGRHAAEREAEEAGTPGFQPVPVDYLRARVPIAAIWSGCWPRWCPTRSPRSPSRFGSVTRQRRRSLARLSSAWRARSQGSKRVKRPNGSKRTRAGATENSRPTTWRRSPTREKPLSCCSASSRFCHHLSGQWQRRPVWQLALRPACGPAPAGCSRPGPWLRSSGRLPL